MSPEQLRGRVTDFRTDQFALGVVLVRGHHRPTSVRRRVARLGDRADLDVFRPSRRDAADAMPPGLWIIIERLLQKDPAERFASTNELAAALAAVRAEAAASPSTLTPRVAPSSTAPADVQLRPARFAPRARRRSCGGASINSPRHSPTGRWSGRRGSFTASSAASASDSSSRCSRRSSLPAICGCISGSRRASIRKISSRGWTTSRAGFAAPISAFAALLIVGGIALPAGARRVGVGADRIWHRRRARRAHHRAGDAAGGAPEPAAGSHRLEPRPPEPPWRLMRGGGEGEGSGHES